MSMINKKKRGKGEKRATEAQRHGEEGGREKSEYRSQKEREAKEKMKR